MKHLKLIQAVAKASGMKFVNNLTDHILVSEGFDKYLIFNPLTNKNQLDDLIKMHKIVFSLIGNLASANKNKKHSSVYYERKNQKALAVLTVISELN